MLKAAGYTEGAVDKGRVALIKAVRANKALELARRKQDMAAAIKATQDGLVEQVIGLSKLPLSIPMDDLRKMGTGSCMKSILPFAADAARNFSSASRPRAYRGRMKRMLVSDFDLTLVVGPCSHVLETYLLLVVVPKPDAGSVLRLSVGLRDGRACARRHARLDRRHS